MRVAVVGGTGALGSEVVRELVARGHQVRIVSRTAPANCSVEHRAADIGTGSGLAEALAGIDTVVATLNAQREAQRIMVDGTRRLLDAELAAGVGHHVEISIVGCDLIPVAYYAAKVAQEEVVTQGPVPWTLLRATQFHGFIDQLLGAAAKYGIAPTGTAKFQPVDIRGVAARLADAADDGPAGRVPDLAGPQVLTLTELSTIRRGHTGRRLLPLRIPMIGKAGAAMRAGAACLREGTTDPVGFAEWLAHDKTRAQAPR